MVSKVSATAKVRLGVPIVGGEAQITVTGDSCNEVLKVLKECASGAVKVAAGPLGGLLERAAGLVKSGVWDALRKLFGFRGS